MSEQFVTAMRVVDAYDPVENGTTKLVAFVDAEGNPIQIGGGGGGTDAPAMTEEQGIEGGDATPMLVSPQVLAEILNAKEMSILEAVNPRIDALELANQNQAEAIDLLKQRVGVLEEAITGGAEPTR